MSLALAGGFLTTGAPGRPRHGFYTVGTVCISLMSNDVVHSFICLLATHISSVVKYVFNSFAHF